ncbi:MAG TPA: hypothetical protein VMA36_18565 [Candidatus Limnocylindria bacterium]|jgi:hypothetical protein|nr:hypothetical protein [Candidatus Limnocylindria bacterium]
MMTFAFGRSLRRASSLVGFAAAVVPSAIVVHLVAEALSLGFARVDEAFVLRHLYLGVLLGASLWAFGATVGIGRGVAEMRRRGALVRAELDPRRPRSLALLLAAYLAFFALTQVGEGVPLLSGDVALGLAAGFAGSLLAALLVFAFGRAFVATAIEALCWALSLSVPALPPYALAGERIARTAASVFSLFVPNRPPPARSSF